MEKEEEESSKNEDQDKEKLRNLFQTASDHKSKKVAKEMVKLTHIETKKQEVDQETINLAKTLKTQYLKHDSFESLTNDELTIIETFEKKRMFLSRIAIIVNQSRATLGLKPFNKAEFEEILGNLIAKGYLATEIVRDNRVYYLTERGKYRTQ